jgi:hypothetical protein
MYLVPNAKDKRLTALRAEARKLGLSVKITSVPKLDPSADERVSAGGKVRDPRIACSAYQLSIGQNNLAQGHALLLKIPAHTTVLLNEVIPGWALNEETDNFWQRYNVAGAGAQIFTQAAQYMPADCLGIAIDNRFVACYWIEKATAEDGTLTRMNEGLAMLRTDFCQRFSRSPQT